MITPETTALILLAAGRSTRFGMADKLTAPLSGQPLGLHAVTPLAAVPFARRIVVTHGLALDYVQYGYEPILNPCPKDGLSLSIRLGVHHARSGAEAVLIALADMPCITATHIHRLFGAQHGPDTIVASSDGVSPKPPALFGAAHFDALEAMQGDHGARDLILRGRHIVANPDELIDVDTVAEMVELRAKVERVND